MTEHAYGNTYFMGPKAYFQGRRPGAKWPFSAMTRTFALAGLLGQLLAPLQVSSAPTNHFLSSGNQPAADPASHAQQVYETARQAFQTNLEAGWQLGRACFDVAGFASNNVQRAQIARQGIDACRKALTAKPNSAPAHYYLAMNLGRLADTKRNLAALRLVREMEREFKAALALDEHLDFAGPDRNLGLLYEEAPRFISIGNRGKARQHLQRAVALAPTSPENRLDLIEAYLRWGDRTGALGEWRALEEILPQARKTFSGVQWAASWLDWQRRIALARQKLGMAAPAR